MKNKIPEFIQDANKQGNYIEYVPPFGGEPSLCVVSNINDSIEISIVPNGEKLTVSVKDLHPTTVVSKRLRDRIRDLKDQLKESDRNKKLYDEACRRIGERLISFGMYPIPPM